MSCYPWQLSQWQSVNCYRQQQRVPQALLLSGIQGLGKFDFARHFAASLLCEKTSDDGVPCGGCHSCRLVNTGNHPDYYELQPEEAGKAIKVDAIRSLSASLLQSAHGGSYKVAVITPAEAMNVAAANALLKTLEEPAGSTVLMLVCHGPSRLLPTVRSRCQQITFHPADFSQAGEWLNHHLPKESSYGSEQLLQLAQGAPLQALAFTSEALSLRRQIIDDLLSLANQQGDPISIAGTWVKYEPQSLFYWLSSLIMDLIKLRSSNDEQSLANQDLIKYLRELIQRLQLKELYPVYDEICNGWQLVVKSTSVNYPLLIENLLIKFSCNYPLTRSE